MPKTGVVALKTPPRHYEKYNPTLKSPQRDKILASLAGFHYKRPIIMTQKTTESQHRGESGQTRPENRTEERARKRAEALRDNLKKRKAQSNLRVSQTEPNGE